MFSAVGRLSPDFIVQDGVVPRSRLGEALQRIEQLSEEYGLRVANVFHAGDGNLHPLILFDGRQAGQLEKAEELAARIVNVCVEMGGSITGEHGGGMEKRQFLEGMFSDVSIDCMRRIRRSCDPAELANRGKMFPTGEPSALGIRAASVGKGRCSEQDVTFSSNCIRGCPQFLRWLSNLSSANCGFKVEFRSE